VFFLTLCVYLWWISAATDSDHCIYATNLADCAIREGKSVSFRSEKIPNCGVNEFVADGTG
jgi:hypothetical protein